MRADSIRGSARRRSIARPAGRVAVRPPRAIFALVLAAALAPSEAFSEEPPLFRLTETPDLSETQPDWSPDGATIVFTTVMPPESDLWTVSAEGTNPRRLTHDAPAEVAPSWSPDGTRIAFSSARGGAPNIWILTLADSSIVPFTRNRGRTHNPRWSPDGREIAYYGIESGDEQIWSAPVAGGPARRLTWHATQSWNPSWSPGGDEIAFSAYRNAVTGGSLFVMPRAGEGDSCRDARPLTRGRAHRWDRFLDWSPNGAWVAFTAQDSAGNWDIWLVSVDGATEVRVTEDPAQEGWPSWSPDSRRLVFDSDRAGNRDLWIADVSRWTASAAPALVRFTSGPDNDYAPVWSADGREILFHSWRGGETHDLWVAPAAGGEPRRLPTGPGNDGSADWAADGRIVYSAYRPGASEQDIFVLEPGGTPRPLVEGASDDYSPTWSPDGALVCFISNRTGTPDVWVVESGRPGSDRLLVGGAGPKGYPSWSASGARVLFAWNRADSGGIYAAPVEGRVAGPPERLVGGDGHYVKHPVWAPGDGAIAFVRLERGRRQLCVSAWRDDRWEGARPVPLPDSLTVDFPDWSPDGRRIAFSAYGGGPSQIYVVTDPGGFLALPEGPEGELPKSR